MTTLPTTAIKQHQLGGAPLSRHAMAYVWRAGAARD